jgi:hypothetical protein
VYSAAVAQQPARIRAGSPAAPARFGDYLMCGLLARGGMAEVYLARHQAAPLGDVRALLAIKVMQPRLAKEARFVDMFRREGELALLLGGPCIVRTHAVGHEGGRPFIAMEYIPGRDLTQLMRRLQDTRTRLPIPHAVYLAARVAEGLAAAHGARDAEGRALHVVNRDVSPSNVRLSWDGDVKLLDFGIAQALMAFTSEIGVLKGKFSYMSPEQIRGMPLDARTDVFSTGIILHEMLTGEKLFRGDTEFALMERVRSADVAPPSRVNPKVSRELDAIVMRALAREVDDRYGSAAQLASDLDVLVRGYKFRPAELRQLMRQTFRKECADELAAAELAAKASAPADDAGELADHEGFEDLGRVDADLDVAMLDELEAEIEANSEVVDPRRPAGSVVADGGGQATQPERGPGVVRRTSGAALRASATPVTSPHARVPHDPERDDGAPPDVAGPGASYTGVLVRPATAPAAADPDGPPAPPRSALAALMRRKPRP